MLIFVGHQCKISECEFCQNNFAEQSKNFADALLCASHELKEVFIL